jgi:hypothetical protein
METTNYTGQHILNHLGGMCRKVMALLSFLIVCVVYTHAQVTVTGSNGANGSYTTLKLAFDAINIKPAQTGNNIQIAISASINDNNTATLNAGTWTTLKIYPTTTNIIITGSVLNTLIQLNGADNVTIDGRVNATGTTKSMKITNTNVNSSYGVISFTNDASNNTVRYCYLIANVAGYGVVSFLSGTTTGNNYNTIDSNDITSTDLTNQTFNLVYSAGSSSTLLNKGDSIINNNIYNFAYRGCYLVDYNTDWTISGNSFYNTIQKSEPQGILITSNAFNFSSSFTITNNYIGGTAPLAGGTPFVCIGNPSTLRALFSAINCNTAGGVVSTIHGNVVKNISVSSSYNDSFITGIVTSGNMDIKDNIIGDTLTNNSITMSYAGSSTTSNRTFYGISHSSVTAGTANIENNSIGGVTCTSTTNYGVNMYGISTTVSGDVVKNNIIGGSALTNSMSASSASPSYAQCVYGIYGSTTATGNRISNLNNAGTNAGCLAVGIFSGSTVSNNTINDISGASPSSTTYNVAGIVGGLTINNNTIYNLKNTNTSSSSSVVGIYVNSSSNCSGNYIYNLFVTGASSTSASIYGINAFSGTSTYWNNVINLGGNTKTTLYGIYDAGSSSQNCNIYFNTVYLSGTLASGSGNTSYCLYRATAANTCDYRNNLLVNARSTVGGSSKHYAISLAANTGLTCDNNDYWTSGTGGMLGYLSSNKADITAWQGATGKDVSSLSDDPGIIAPDNTALSYIPGNTHLYGVSITGITKDYRDSIRHATPTMGAFEIKLELPVEVWKNNALQSGYVNLGKAFAAINAGTHTGALDIKIKAKTNETSSAVLYQSGYTGAGGTSSYTSVNIYPTTTGLSISSPAGGLAAPLIDLNGADYVTIDGRVNQAGSSDMTIVNKSVSSTGGTSTIRLINSAAYNVVKYCIIKGSTLDPAGGVVFFSTATTAPGNSNNTVDNCRLTGTDDTNRPVNMIYSTGSATYTNINDTISNNWVYDFFNRSSDSYGINLLTYTSDWTIKGNRFSESNSPFTPASSTPVYNVIYINNTSGNNFAITNNYIGGTADKNGMWTKSATVYNNFVGIYLQVGSTIASTVQGDTIKNIAWKCNNTFYGMYINGGTVDVNGNTIGSDTGTGSLNLSNSGLSNTSFVGIYAYGSPCTVNCKNNTVGSISGTFSGNSGGVVSGILLSYITYCDISNNRVGSETTTGSISATSANPTQQVVVSGIQTYVLGSTSTASGNQVANLVNNSTNSMGVVFGIGDTWKGTTNITGNTIHDLKSADSNTITTLPGTTSVSSTSGIIYNNATGSATGNTIYNLSNTNASFTGQVVGILTGLNNTQECSGNFIHDLSVSSSTAFIYGIKNPGSTGTVANNIIALGGNTSTTLYGISDESTTGTSKIYFNTVYLSGTPGTPSKASYCFNSFATTNTSDYRNNLFVNARSTNGTHYAIFLSAATTNACDNNDYWTSGTGGVLGYLSGSKSTLLLWQGATGKDVSSLSHDPGIPTPGNTALSYTPTYKYLYGVSGTGISTDYFNINRNTTPTIGAIEIALDLPVEVWIGTNLKGGYVNLGRTFIDINSGVHKTDLDVRIKASIVETTSAVLNASGSGLASYTSITIHPTAAGLTVSGNLAAPLIDLNGADKVTIDGRNGSIPSLTITNTSAVSTGGTSTIRFVNGASNDTVRYCTIKGSTIDPAGGVVFFSATAANSNNVITSNTITNAGSRPINVIYSNGAAGQINSGNIISNNTIFDFWNPSYSSYGISMYTYTSGWSITGNRFYETTSTFTPSANVDYYIISANSGDSYSIKDNIIGGDGSAIGINTNGGVWTRAGTSWNNNFCAINMPTSTTAATSIQNNTIGGFSWPSAPNVTWTGIASQGAASVGDVTGNTIGGSSNITVSSASGVVTFYGISATGGGIIQNNTLGGTGSIQLSSSGGAGTFYGIYANKTGTTISGNTIGATTGTGMITVTNGVTGGNCYGISSAGGTVSNNNIGAITAATSGATLANNLYGIYTSGSSACTINNNTIGSITDSKSLYASSASTSNAQSVYGIYNSSSGTIGMTGNTIANLTNGTTNPNTGTVGVVNGITSITGANTISNNVIHDLTIVNANNNATNTCAVGGIVFSGTGAANTATGNIIYGLSNTYGTFAGQVAGIYFTGNTVAASCSTNFIYNLTVSSSSGASVYGIKKASGKVTMANNIIALGAGTANSEVLYGIYEAGAGSNNTTLYFNTVYLGGAPTTGALASYALYSAGTAIRIFQNNLLVNARSNAGATGVHYAVYLVNTTLTLNYNDYWVSGSGSQLGYAGGAKSSVPIIATDVNSKNVDPIFANAGGTSAKDYGPASAVIVGLPGTGITTDYLGATRSIPTMGAIEQTLPTVSTQPVTNIFAVSATGNGTIETLGMPEKILEYGVCWSNTNATPTVANYRVNNGTISSIGRFISAMSLVGSTKYYVRAYASNIQGNYVYGGTVTFVTLPPLIYTIP